MVNFASVASAKAGVLTSKAAAAKKRVRLNMIVPL
jgi:hypothetical protein